jgi:hypothetical protein
LNRMNAILDWKQGKLTVTGKNTSVTVPVVCTKKKTTNIESTGSEESETETETDSDFEFEKEEGTRIVPVYFSDSFSDTDLEYNPWLDYEVQKREKLDKSN